MVERDLLISYDFSYLPCMFRCYSFRPISIQLRPIYRGSMVTYAYSFLPGSSKRLCKPTCLGPSQRFPQVTVCPKLMPRIKAPINGLLINSPMPALCNGRRFLNWRITMQSAFTVQSAFTAFTVQSALAHHSAFSVFQPIFLTKYFKPSITINYARFNHAPGSCTIN